MRRLLMLILILIISGTVYADYPLPELVPITVDNAAQVSELASVGGDLPGQLAWSPDGTRLAVGIRSAVKIYDAADLSQAPKVLDVYAQNLLWSPDGSMLAVGVRYGVKLYETDDFSATPISIAGQSRSDIPAFDALGNLKYDGQVWNVQTGEALPQSSPEPIRHLNHAGDLEAIPISIGGRSKIILSNPNNPQSTPISSLDIGDDGRVTEIIFSPDDRYIGVVLEEDGLNYPDSTPNTSIQLWDVGEKRLVHVEPSTYGVLDFVDFSIDSQTFFFALIRDTEYYGLNPYETISFWDVETGETTFNGSIFVPGALVRQGEKMVFDALDKLTFWDGYKITPLEAHLCIGSESPYTEFRFEKNDQLLIVAGIDSDCRGIGIWDLSSGQISAAPTYTLIGGMNFIQPAFSRDDSLLVIYEADGLTHVRNAADFSERYRFEGIGHAFSPDGRLIVGALGNDRALWDASTGNVVITLPADFRLNPTWTYAGRWLDTTTVQVVEIATGTMTDLAIIGNYHGELWAVSAEQSYVLFKDVTGLQAYDLQTGEKLFGLPDEQFVAMSADGTRLATVPVGPASPLMIRNAAEDGALITAINVEDRDINLFGRVLFSPDNRLVAYHRPEDDEGRSDYVYLFDAAEGKLVADWETGIYGIGLQQFSPDNRLLIVSAFFTVKIWDVSAALETGMVTDAAEIDFAAPYDEIQQLMVSADGSKLVIKVFNYPLEAPDYYGNFSLYLFDVPQLIERGGTADMIVEPATAIPDAFAITFSAEGEYILTSIGLYSADSGELIASLSAQTGAFSPDGTLLAVEEADGVGLYAMDDLVMGQVEPLTVLPQREDVLELAWSPDGTLLFSRTQSQVTLWGVGK